MKFKLVIILLLISSPLFALEGFGVRGGDDAGNGGFAYKQSIKILEMATKNLEHKIIESNLKEFDEHPERRQILQETLTYDHLQQLPKKNASRGGRILQMDYVMSPASVKILKPYYEAFMGRTDGELDEASLEVEKRLLHEASHIWGYNEVDSEAFALRFLSDAKVSETRPTNQIDIRADFCSCINGKSDLINDCDSFCSQKPITSSPILYLNTIMGPDIVQNPKLGNLYNWCNVALAGDTVSPQCFLNVNHGMEGEENLPVTISQDSNSLSANIQSLSPDKTYVLKIVEGRTGSNAQSTMVLIRRKTPISDTERLYPLSWTYINQYSCLTYGGRVDSNGDVARTSFVKDYYYFADNETPRPMPPTSNGVSPIVCHDEQKYPGNDSSVYPRLELVSQFLVGWDKSDTRFLALPENEGKLKINKMIEQRLLNEYGVTATTDLFRLIGYPASPLSGPSADPLVYMMLPFNDQNTGRSFCPTVRDMDGTDPLMQVLQRYVGNTIGLYVAEKEAEVVGDNQKIIYGTMFTNETILRNYGFYIENGIKIRADKNALHTKTIYYYWPINNTQDPLTQGTRKLFTVKYPDQLKGNVPTGIPRSIRTSDKRIGCIPEGKLE